MPNCVCGGGRQEGATHPAERETLMDGKEQRVKNISTPQTEIIMVLFEKDIKLSVLFYMEVSAVAYCELIIFVGCWLCACCELIIF